MIPITTVIPTVLARIKKLPLGHGLDLRTYIAFTVTLVAIWTRSGLDIIPGLVADFGADTLWALTVFLIVGMIVPYWSTSIVALIAVVISVLVEVSQFYHAPWIDMIRQTRIGGMALGHCFQWSDLVCYAVGIGRAALIETAFKYPGHHDTDLTTSGDGVA